MNSHAKSLFVQSSILVACSFAYVEFVEESSLVKAVELDESLFKGRQIKVRMYM